MNSSKIELIGGEFMKRRGVAPQCIKFLFVENYMGGKRIELLNALC